jgi:hypothetical protein
MVSLKDSSLKPPVVTNENKDAGSDEGNVSSSESEDEDDLKASGEKFEIHFDKTLFEPPEIIKIMHFKLETMAKTQ